MDLDVLKAELTRDEGLRLQPYRDSVGKLTIGVGHNLDANGITYAAAMQILEDDILNVMGQLNSKVSWWATLDDAEATGTCEHGFQSRYQRATRIQSPASQWAGRGVRRSGLAR